MSSAAAICAAAMQRNEVIRELNCILAFCENELRFLCVQHRVYRKREGLEEDEGGRSLKKKARHYRGLVKQF